jgi:hydrogenase expression/formation protein HypE
MNNLPTGKLPPELLDDLLTKYTSSTDSRVLVGPRVGEDAAVIDFGETLLVAKTDPITFATDEIGYYAIHVSANDIATMGATPKWYLPTLLLPQGSDAASIAAIFESIHSAAADIGVTICGGHTEITAGLDRPIIAGQMLGEVSPSALVTSDGLKEGDRILLTKGLGIEGTAILARELADELEGYGVSNDVVSRSVGFLRDPGISVLPEARIACEFGPPHAMHDPTEGGVATALHELASASNVGLAVYEDALHAAPETQVLCKALSIDPLGLISSGALLIGLGEDDVDPVRTHLEKTGISSEVIARVESPKFGIRIGRGTNWTDLPSFARDELARIFDEDQ